MDILNTNRIIPLLILPISIGLLIALSRVKIQPPNPPNFLRSILIGIIVGVVCGVLFGLLVSLQPERRQNQLTLLQLALLPTIQLANAATNEEPLFRGFLWGWLEKKGWPDGRIWLFQAGLFWLGHLYYFGVSPISFWVVVPFGGLVLGLVAWRSRDIAPSMLAHSLTNGMAQIVAGI